MEKTASIDFKIISWDETIVEAYGGFRKLTRAAVQKTFSRDLSGEGSLEYLMAYSDETYACFVGMERITGQLGGRAGRFVLQHVGTFEGGISKGSLLVVPGSATDELEGLTGEGTFSLGHAEIFHFELRYALP